MTRREILARTACGFGMAALTGMMEGAETNPLAPKAPPLPAKAKSVIYLHMHGGVSHVDTFDPKPELTKYTGKPLSADLTTVHDFLDEAVVGVAGTETAIGDAIGLAIKRLRAQADSGHPAPPGQTVLVLLTDGVNDAGAMPPLEAAKLAAQSGLRIYTIGVGAADDGGFFGGGNSDLDEQTLQQIAKLTGGEYFRATDANALQAVYRQIDRLEPAAGTQQWLRPADEWFDWPLAAALLLSLPAVGMRRWT